MCVCGVNAGGMGLGAAGGAAIARRMAITELPQMVAAFHSLVGLAAVTTSIASFMAHPALAAPIHLTASYLGTLIGAVTLTGAPTPPSQRLLQPALQGDRASRCTDRPPAVVAVCRDTARVQVCSLAPVCIPDCMHLFVLINPCNRCHM